MKRLISPSTWPAPHRFAGLPFLYYRKSRAPFLLRLQAGCWRILFSTWHLLRPPARLHIGGLDRVLR